MEKAKEIFNTKSEFNKWLTILTESEKALVIEMIQEGIDDGYSGGYNDATKEACAEINENYMPAR